MTPDTLISLSHRLFYTLCSSQMHCVCSSPWVGLAAALSLPATAWFLSAIHFWVWCPAVTNRRILISWWLTAYTGTAPLLQLIHKPHLATTVSSRKDRIISIQIFTRISMVYFKSQRESICSLISPLSVSSELIWCFICEKYELRQCIWSWISWNLGCLSSFI